MVPIHPYVESNLVFPAHFRFVNGLLHGRRRFVSIQNGLALDIARHPSNHLNQRMGRSQKPGVIGLENGNQRGLWNVQALAQQADTDQDVEFSGAQSLNDLDPLVGLDVRM